MAEHSDRITVEIPWARAWQGINVACVRQVTNVEAGRVQRYGATNSFSIGLAMHILGSLGEQAVAKWLGEYWDGAIGDFSAGDVGKLQVRAMEHATHKLILHDSDSDNDKFILAYVTGTNHNAIIVLYGWCYGREGKSKEFEMAPNDRPPAYFIPPLRLRPMRTLKGDS